MTDKKKVKITIGIYILLLIIAYTLYPGNPFRTEDKPSKTPVSQKGFLTITTNVDDAALTIDGRPAGLLPVEDVELPAGSHRIAAQADGYEPYKKNVVIKSGQDFIIDVEFEKKGPGEGSLHVSTEPADALVKILNIGSKYTEGMSLAPGRYHVQVARDGYRTSSQWVIVAAGENKYVTISLEKMKASVTPRNDLAGLKVKLIHINSRSEDARVVRERLERYGATVSFFQTNNSGNDKHMGKIYYQSAYRSQAQQIANIISDIETVKAVPGTAFSSGQHFNLWVVKNQPSGLRSKPIPSLNTKKPNESYFYNTVWRQEIQNGNPPEYHVQLRPGGTFGHNQRSASSFTHQGDDKWRIENGKLLLIWNNGYCTDSFQLDQSEPEILYGTQGTGSRPIIMKRLR